ncbi:MAG: hypothetical protein ABI837_14410 [Acidobacteriota bacterium]
MEKKDRDPMSSAVSTSSVVMKAIDAKTFTEMEAFVKDLESRSTERLLRDLADLATLPGAKVSLVGYVLAGKYKQADADGRTRIKDAIVATSEQLDSGEPRDRVTAMLDRLR